MRPRNTQPRQAAREARARRCPAFAAASLLLLGGLAPSPAAATPDTLKRSMSNILCAPFDLILSPVVGAKSVVDGVADIDDSVGVRIAYPVVGVVWNTAMVIGLGVIREIAGLIELVPGLLLLYSEADMDPLLDPVENSEGLVDIETPVLYIKFGLFYVP